MAKVDETFVHADVITLMNALVDDIKEVSDAIKAVTAKLDADATVTYTNYAATCDPAAQTVTKS